MHLLADILFSAWDLLLDSALYVLFGILIGGLLRVFLNPASVARHLGEGRIASVFKAALIGVPMPLCSCGVLPAAAALKRQGANNGAVTAFLISTPESGVDSIALSYALLDPIMTVARPLVGALTALVAGVAENLLPARPGQQPVPADLTCQVDGCCDGVDCPPEVHSAHHGPGQKLAAGIGFAFGELWADLVGWFFAGILIAGAVTRLIPQDAIAAYLGGGVVSMLAMLAVGIPIYICATASTPVAAALILKGVSPGAALVFLIAGPATNLTSLTVLVGLLGKRATAVYLGAIAVMAVLSGLALDAFYAGLGISARATMGAAAELLPGWARLAGAVVLIAISIRPLGRKLAPLFTRRGRTSGSDHGHDCGCSDSGHHPE